MQEKQLYEYAVIRLVPRVDREEFLNVGVIVYCAKQRFLKTLIQLDAERIHSFFPGLEIESLRKHFKTLQLICNGDPAAGPIAKLTVAERFRWLTATRSTIIQTSKVHPGFCSDADKTLDKLYRQLVL
ncbi:MAG: DUF3037 domain-containing protein [Ginsengibacter sp.]